MLYLINMTSFVNQFPILFGLFIFLFGLCIGSFLNVVIYRLPLILYRDNGIDGESKNSDGAEDTKVFNLAFPRSFCPTCRNSLRWTENIPVFSYIFLKGRCRGCSVSIGLKYPLIELLTGLATLFLILYFGCTFKFLTRCILIYALIVLCFIDLDHFLLPDSLTIPLIWLGLFFNSFAIYVNLNDAVYGAIFGYLILWAIFWVFKWITGKNGFGYGDFKLLSALGAWLGWTSLPMIVFISTLVGSVVGITLLLFKKINRETPIPFGPYLIIAGIAALLLPQFDLLKY